jgi:polysaccharide pyruvyl transferase WcaK-like protein
VRDDASVDLLKRWGLPHERAPDLAFAWADAAYECKQRVGNVMTIGLTARTIGEPSQQAVYENSLATAINELMSIVRAEGHEPRLLLCPQVTGPLPAEDDRPVLERVAERIDDDGTLVELSHENVATALATYRELDFLIATRLHSAILASCVHVPFVVYEYIGGKARGVVRDLDLPAWTAVDRPEDLAVAVARGWKCREMLSECITRRHADILGDIAQVTSVLHLPKHSHGVKDVV